MNRTSQSTIELEAIFLNFLFLLFGLRSILLVLYVYLWGQAWTLSLNSNPEYEVELGVRTSFVQRSLIYRVKNGLYQSLTLTSLDCVWVNSLLHVRIEVDYILFWVEYVNRQPRGRKLRTVDKSLITIRISFGFDFCSMTVNMLLTIYALRCWQVINSLLKGSNK